MAASAQQQQQPYYNEQPWINDHDDYDEISQLGQGAYGVVYLVRNRHTNQEYALKKIKVPLSEDGVPQSVIREISALKAIERADHPNITKLVDVCHGLLNEHELYISVIFEKCDWDLYDFLQRIPVDMSDVQIRHMAKQIFQGIDFLHSHNIVHRDLKPQNVLVNRDQSVKLTDFGLARSYSLQSAFTTIVVTLWYRAPELLLQCQYNTAVDLWSAGCILAELYSRQPLFNGQTEAEQLTIIFQKMGTPSVNAWPTDAVLDRSVYPSYPSVPLERQLPLVPLEGLRVISALLRFTPSDRPSAQEVLQSDYFLNGPICTFAT